MMIASNHVLHCYLSCEALYKHLHQITKNRRPMGTQLQILTPGSPSGLIWSCPKSQNSYYFSGNEVFIVYFLKDKNVLACRFVLISQHKQPVVLYQRG